MTSPADMLDVLSCIPNLYAWIYDENETLLYSNCPSEDRQNLFHRLFLECNYHAYLHEYAKTRSAPYALSIYMGLVWYAVLEKEADDLKRIYLLGPAFQYPVSLAQLERTLAKYEAQGMNSHSKRQLLKAMGQLPVIPHTQLASYAILLHYCVTGKKVTYQELHSLQDDPRITPFKSTKSAPSHAERPDFGFPGLASTRVSVPLSEPLEDFYAGTVTELGQKAIDISPSTYKTIRDTERKLAGYLHLGLPAGQDPQAYRPSLLPTDASGIQSPVGKLKASAIMMVSLCARTAVEAGLTYEEAYRLADEYLGKIENEPHSPVGLQNLMKEISREFYEHLQKRRRESRAYGREVTLCMDYVQNHLAETVELKTLARLIGYTPYYLSRKFKEETGQSLREYVRARKMEYAALLLATTDDDIQSVMEKIGLSSRSHFSQDFQAVIGMSPAAYRAAKRI